MTLKDAWRRGQHGWPADKPVAQFPNPPLLTAAAGWLLAAATDGTAHDLGRAIFYAGLAVWAWLELTSGLNRVRRVMGAAGLVFVAYQVARAVTG
jgi:hypothetical protein